MRFIVRYRGAPSNDNFEKVCQAGEIEKHVQYMLDCCVSYLDVEILVCQQE